MRKGDASLDTLKEGLGWIIDALNGTIALPLRRQDRLRELLASFPHQRRQAAIAKWHQFIGELRSMSLAIPGLRGCFSILQDVLDPLAKRIKLSAAVHNQIDDIRWLARDLSARPTRIAELIPGPADYVGTTDACKAGMGGVWLPFGHVHHPPFIFRSKFPSHIQQRLVNFDNPHGDITMGELELAARIAGDLVLATKADLTEANVVCGSDSTNAGAWLSKGSSSSQGAHAYLLRMSAFLRRHHRYQSHTIFIPGPFNTMADDASRLWSLTDSQLLHYFDSNYPQKESWRLLPLPTNWNSALISLDVA